MPVPPNPNPPPKDPVRMSNRLRDAIVGRRHTHSQPYKDMAAAAGINAGLLSQLLHGKVVGRGDLRLAAIGRWMGLPPEEWEEPA
jgi:hypothetical protein